MKSFSLCAALLCASANFSFAQTTDRLDQAETQTKTKLEEMVVIASRLPVAASRVGNAVTVIDAQMVEDIGYGYGADTFRFIPGVAVGRNGGYGGFAQLRLRGGEANHSVFLIDGIDVSSASTGEFDVSSLLGQEIDRIEVLRGPQSGLYGSNALSGVISVRTKRPSKGWGLATGGEVGSDDLSQHWISLNGGAERLGARLSYIQRQSKLDISSNDTLLGGEDDQDRNRTFSGQAYLQPTDQLSIELFGRFVDKETDTDGFDFGGGPLQGLPIDDLSESNTQEQTLGGVVTYRAFDQRSVSRLSVNSAESEILGAGFGNEATREQVRLESSWLWNAADTWRTTLFFQDQEETFKNLFAFDPSQRGTQRRDVRSYGFEQRAGVGDDLSMSLAVRHDENEAFDDATAYSLAASYTLPGGQSRLHGSWGKGVTNPTFFEQFGFVPANFIGNLNLQPEESQGWDVGVEHVFSFGGANANLKVDLTYFRADLEQEIREIFPTVVNIVGDSDRQGAELAIGVEADNGLRVELAYTYTDADQPDGREVRRPEHVASLLTAQDFLAGKLRIAGSVVYNGTQLDTDFRRFFSNGFVSEVSELDSYTLANVSGRYIISDGLEAFVRVENIFDEQYEDAIGYQTPGRTVIGGVRLSFGAL